MFIPDPGPEFFSMPRRCETSVPDPCHFETDPGPLIRSRDYGSSSGTVDSFTPEITSHKKQLKSRFFLIFFAC